MRRRASSIFLRSFLSRSRARSSSAYSSSIVAHEHVHPLKHDTVRVALHIQHPFIAQHVRSVNLYDPGQELLELRALERLVRAECEGADVLVVLVLAVLEEPRIELEGRVEVETADIENVLDRRVADMEFL